MKKKARRSALDSTCLFSINRFFVISPYQIITAQINQKQAENKISNFNRVNFYISYNQPAAMGSNSPEIAIGIFNISVIRLGEKGF